MVCIPYCNNSSRHIKTRVFLLFQGFPGQWAWPPLDRSCSALQSLIVAVNCWVPCMYKSEQVFVFVEGDIMHCGIRLSFIPCFTPYNVLLWLGLSVAPECTDSCSTSSPLFYCGSNRGPLILYQGWCCWFLFFLFVRNMESFWFVNAIYSRNSEMHLLVSVNNELSKSISSYLYGFNPRLSIDCA